MSYCEKYKVDVPEGVSGIWEVKRFEVGNRDAHLASVRALCSGGRGGLATGVYTKLTRANTIVMSDTPDEISDHMAFVHKARGRVLIHGLGLGMCLNAILSKDSDVVQHVTVIEKSPDVIRLVGPHYENKFGDRLTIIEGDAFHWTPPAGSHWDTVWHDIWDTLCTDNLKEMHTLHRRFGRRSNWQGSWGRELCEYRKKKDDRERRYMRWIR